MFADPEGNVSGEIVACQEALASWYQTHARDLPWRRTQDPYAIWVSEIMCQQTQVSTVIPYYERWLRAFPDAGALAAADLNLVLEHWAGLGYYRRARTLHAAAAAVAQNAPTSYAEWLQVPGVGRYTAGAIASIAYGERVAAVDGNVDRVISRWFEVGGFLSASKREKRVWKLADQLVPNQRPGDHNQAMMELGATVCTPRQPQCQACPVADFCQSREHGTQSDFPPVKVRTKPRDETTTLWVFSRDAEVALRQRPLEGLHGGLWEFPSSVGPPPAGAEVVGEFLHVFSHIRMRYVVVRGQEPPDDLRWTSRPRDYAVSTAMRKALGLIGK